MFRAIFGLTAFLCVVSASNHYQSTRMSEIIGGIPDCNSRLYSEITCYTPGDPPNDPCTTLNGFRSSGIMYHVIMNWNLHVESSQQYQCKNTGYRDDAGRAVKCAGNTIEPGTKNCNYDYFTFWIF
jgi:hypothetical protein